LQSKPLTDQRVERMRAWFAPGARHGDQVAARTAGRTGDAGEVVSQK